MTVEAAPPSHEIVPAKAEDMPFIRETVERLRLDGERLETEQFLVARGQSGVLGFGRIKPYEETYELGAVAVVEEQRGRGLGEAIVRELVRRFPRDEVYTTTDIPEYFGRLGFLRTEMLPRELVEKVERVCGELRPGTVGMVYDRRVEALPTLADVYKAKHTVEPHLKRTPLLRSAHLSERLGCEAYLKLENLQPIGAFKVRGGVNLAASLPEEDRSWGIVGASTGNHGQSIAYAARMVGAKCIIAVPEGANELKVAAMEGLGADVRAHGRNFDETRLWAEDVAKREGMRYVHHASTPELVAGVATISLEIIEDLPDVDVIIGPIGGGSGIVGHCIVAKALRPDVELIAVQAEGAPCYYRSWKERKLQKASIDTIAEGLATGTPFFAPVRMMIDRLDDFVLVSDDEMREAIALLLRTSKQLAEPAGAASTAAALKLGERLRGKKVALVLSGGNITPDQMRDVLNRVEG